jgi:predicted RND superfamily exporter protein
MKSWIRKLLHRAGWVTAIGAILSMIGLYFTVHLFSNLRTDIEELLPSRARSVLDLNEVRSRLESSNSLEVIFFSDHPDESRKLVDALAEEARRLPKDTVAGVEYRIDREIRFFEQRKPLFVETSDLDRIRKYIRQKIDYETALYNPLTILGNVSLKEPRLDINEIRRKYESRTGPYKKFPGGYYASPDEKIRVMIIHQPGGSTGISNALKLRGAIDGILLKLSPKSIVPDVEVRFSGGVQDLIEEHEALIEDLALSTLIVCVLVALAMFIYFRSVVATICLLLSLFAGTLWTFGAGYFLVGYLNANSAFMASIVIGNGINFGIILLARFMEERRKRKDVVRSIAISAQKSMSATAVAAGAAALAYGSLGLTSFRGFQQFGILGFTGMVLCWISAYTVLPGLLLLASRMGLMRRAPRPRTSKVMSVIREVISKHPKALVGASAVITALSTLSLLNANSTIIETDMKKLRNRQSLESGSMHWSTYVDRVFERYLSPIVVLPKKTGNVLPIEKSIQAVQEREKDTTFITGVSSIHDFLPGDQPEKIRILEDISLLLTRSILYQLPVDERRMAQELLAPEARIPFGEADLPELVREKFREKDGTLGKLVLVEPSLSPELAKSENLIHFVKSIRDAADQVEPGAAVAGTLPVTADLFESIIQDGPKATVFAFLAVFLMIVLLFREKTLILQCSFALWVGVLWLAGFIFGFHQKINFLNFIALPITFGIGVDYGVNIFQRYRLEKGRGILSVIQETGGAVLLASLTTVTGYGSLLIASNQAFVSFGRLAIVGEFTCVFAAVISLPALLWLLEKKKGSQ